MISDDSKLAGDCECAGKTHAADSRVMRDEIAFDGFLREMLEAIPEYVMILSADGRLLTANNRFLRDFGLTRTLIFDRRPGDVLGCLNTPRCSGGCMTGEHCTTCGAATAITESREKNVRIANECRIISEKGGTVGLDFEVTASPLVINDMRVIFCVMKDISSEKRRKVLERVFFHDVMNTVSGISSLAELLAGGDEITPDEKTIYTQWLVDLSGRLAEEIKQQRKLLAAEQGELKPDTEPLRVLELMRSVHALYATHSIAEDRNLVLGEVPDVLIMTDPSLLRRILGNLVKNALEAVNPGETVTIYCNSTEEGITFCVHNPGVIPRDVQLQLFQRSFSTKAAEGRGIGTYSVKLFGERYLKGRVSFTSNEEDGTIFRLSLPMLPPEPAR